MWRNGARSRSVSSADSKAGEIRARVAEQDRHLQRKDVLPVEVLVQAVVVRLAVAQHQRRRPNLAGVVAAADELGVSRRKARRHAERFVPSVCHRSQPRIERLAQLRHRLRQRIGEVPVLATAVAMARHHHTTAEDLFPRIERHQGIALRRRQQPGNPGAAAGVELGLDVRPDQGIQAFHDPAVVGVASHRLIQHAFDLLRFKRDLLREAVRRAHCAASMSSSRRLRSSPQR